MPGNDSALGYFSKLLNGQEVHSLLGGVDPVVRVIVINAARSTAKCRTDGEQYRDIVEDRSHLRVVKQLETRWTICDLEDYVMGNGSSHPQLGSCKLRCRQGIYGQPRDDLHFRSDIDVEACREVLLACQRSASYLKESDVLLVIGAGWNVSGKKTWRKLEMIALRELCELSGRPLSNFQMLVDDLICRSLDKKNMLSKRSQEAVHQFFKQNVARFNTGSVQTHCHREGQVFKSSMAASAVVRAWYGEWNVWWSQRYGQDVTEIVKNLLEATSEIVVKAEIFGDPAPGMTKVLLIDEQIPNSAELVHPSEASYGQAESQNSKRRFDRKLNRVEQLTDLTGIAADTAEIILQNVEYDVHAAMALPMFQPPAPASSADSLAREAKRRRLLEMGFQEKEVSVALKDSQCDLSSAIDVLVQTSSSSAVVQIDKSDDDVIFLD